MSFILPILALNVLDDLCFSTKRRDYYPINHYPHNPHSYPCWNARCITPMNFQWDQQRSGRMQKTSIKVHDAYAEYYSKSNVGITGSPRQLNSFINDLERREQRTWQRPQMLAEIKTARSVVAHATTTFDEIQKFEKKLIQLRNGLRQQTKTDNVKEQLSLIKNLLAKIGNISLPDELTQNSVEVYAKIAQETIQNCEKELAVFEQTENEKLSHENQKTNAQGTTVIASQTEDKSLDGTEEVVVGPTEATLEHASDVIVNTLEETVIGPNDNIDTNQASELVKTETDTNDPLVFLTPIKETPAIPEAPFDLFAIKNEMSAKLQNMDKNFENLIEELNQDFKNVRDVYRDLNSIFNEKLEDLKVSVEQITDPNHSNVCLEKIKHLEAALELISELIKSKAIEAKTNGDSLWDISFFAETLMKDMGEFSLNYPLQATYEALNIFLDTDKRCNQRELSSEIENQAFLSAKGFNNIAKEYANHIQQLKDADAIFSKGDSLEIFERYCDEWNRIYDLKLEVLNDLRNSESKLDGILKNASDKMKTWEKNYQFQLCDQLDYLIAHIPRISERVDLPFNDSEAIKAFVASTNELEEKISILIKKDNQPLADLIAYENTNLERAALVNKYFVDHAKNEINTFIALVESHLLATPISTPENVTSVDKLQILLEKARLLQSYEVSTGFFGTGRKQEDIENLTSKNLKKYALEMRSKLDEYKSEFDKILAAV
ncbi:MAG: hypothetical protein H0X29_01425 [Parachlamydiaceae bacterium]|nr:hypothetical protein [Parachlamydiaceae bacterium]